ncbi:MAG TPA: hypothetical protein PK926_06835 [Spirochaetota bacterium]|nr:hypothetical protein [Spirochaetota bacterium]HPI90034.1 hypothetical protein [Spirochaetota bacterium]HPR48084.1 hypothetical protein [Spirochaetota bacterium]
MGQMKDKISSLGKILGKGRSRNERRNIDRRNATKHDRIIFYSKVFSGEVVDRRINLFDRRQSQ